MDQDAGRHPGEKMEDHSSCKDCCERMAWSSLVAAVFSVIGAVMVVVCVGFNSRLAGPLFSNTYIEDAVYSWFSWISIGAYIGLVLMVAMIVLLFSIGCMATGYQNASTWCAFSKAQTGRRQLTGFMILAYVINLGWYVFLFGSTIPIVFFMMLHNGVCTNAVFSATTCLDLRQFGLAPHSLPAAVNSTLICDQNLQNICDSSLRSNFIIGLIGCVLVLIGMNHFMMSISGNYNWLRLRKRRQKLMASQINRRSGTYDLNVSPYTERQESQDSNAHLRRVNLHHGSSSNILTSSNTSIPTVAAHVPLATTASTFAMPATSSSSKTESTSNSSSMQSSKIFNQTYGFDDGAFSQQNGGGARVTFADTKKNSAAFADTKPTSAAAPRSSTTSAASKRPKSDDRNDLSKYADRSFDSSSRYDHFNPAFDENYWDQQQYAPPPEETKSDNYYSKGYNNAPKVNGTATSYDQGNYNQGYYNYDYDSPDKGGHQTNTASSYGPSKPQSYTQPSQSYARPSQSYAHDKSQAFAQPSQSSYAPDKPQSYSEWDKPQSYASDKPQTYAHNNLQTYAASKPQTYAQDNSQSLEQDRKAMGNNFYEYEL